jgi:ABC-type Fe3+/spermidine/putrescine transport system ATPase subunit
MGEVRLQDISISYGGQPVVSRVSLTVQDAEIVALLGPSGAGKTTILKAIAGLIQPEAGDIFIDGSRVNHLPADQRSAVMIFQKPLLFPFLDVAANISFGLRMSGVKMSMAREKIARIVEITGLRGLEARRIHQLSGGQQQRVALARALVLEPSVLLLDEPLSSLDEGLRQQMRELIRDVQQQTGTTMLFVTHDQREAFGLSDRVSLLLDGRLQQTGSPEELFYEPRSAAVARFFGCTNLFDGTISNSAFRHEGLRFKVKGADRASVTVAIRPEDVLITGHPEEQAVRGTILSRYFEGITTRLQVRAGGCDIDVISMHPEHEPGQEVWLVFPMDRCRIFG